MKKIIFLIVSVIFFPHFSVYAQEAAVSPEKVYRLVTTQDTVTEDQEAVSTQVVYHLVTPQDHPQNPQETANTAQENLIVKIQDDSIPNNKNAESKHYEEFKKSNLTSGSYAGFDILEYRVCYLVHDSVYGSPNSYPPPNCGSNRGFGFNYKYAFNHQGFFLAPGAFYEYNLSGPISGRNEVSLDTKYRYGLQFDLGYDLTDRFSPYVIGGYANIYYRSRARGDGLAVDPSGPNGYENLTVGKSGVSGDLFAGIGLKYNLSPDLSLNMEYMRQNYLAEAGVPTESNDYLSNSYFTVKLQIFKAGIYYHF